MSTYQNLLYEKQRSGVLITLNRPERRNALSEALLAELDAALAEAKDDPEVRGVILTGAGGCFSAGEDVSREGVPETVWPRPCRKGCALQGIRRGQGQGPRGDAAAAPLPLGVPQAHHRRGQRLVPRRGLVAGPHLPPDGRR